MPQKVFQCNKCMGKHERSVNSKCHRQEVTDDESVISVEKDTNAKTSDLNQDLGVQILAELKSLSG